MNGDSGLEFLRFGSSIPGNYLGCCAACIIQNFKVDPDAKASIQIVSGDGGVPVGDRFAGPTYRDIFHQRLRFGTFSTADMPNHAFFAILTESQINSGAGAKWLPILKEAGFEFFRTVCNSVYSGQSVVKPGTFGDSSKNHIFVLIRNIGNGAISNPYMPPAAWRALPSVVPEAWERYDIETDKGWKEVTTEVQTKQLDCWNKIGPAKLLTEAEVVAAGAPVILAGMRSEYHRPQPKERRAALDATKEKKETASLKAAPTPTAASDL